MLKKVELTKPVLYICFLLTVIICGMTTLYGDDFIYAVYFYDGIGGFFEKTYEHYTQMNGRAFIHFVLELILIFKDKLFFVVLPAMLTGVFYVFYRNNKTDKNAEMFFTFCCMGVMIVSVKVMREAMLWMSGAANYIFPVIFAVSGFYAFVKLIGNDKPNVLYMIFFFLCGQTTEQCSVIIISASIFYLLFDKELIKKITKTNILYFVCLTAGFLTVVLSPGTSVRMGAESGQRMNLFDSFSELYHMSFGETGILWVFIVSLILLAVSTEIKRIQNLRLLCALCAVTVILSLLGVCSAAGWIYVICAVVTAISGLLRNKKRGYCALYLSALLSIAMMAFTSSFGYRNFMPAILIMICIIASVLCDIIKDRSILTKNIILMVLFVITIISFYPKLSGYISNRTIINDNIASVKSKNSDMYYNVDLNCDYAYNQFFTDSFYEENYRRIYNVPEDSRIHLKGSDFEDLYCNGEFCENPIYNKDGKSYYPLRDVVEAYDGEISYNKENKLSLISINDIVAEFDKENGLFCVGENIYNAYDYILEDFKYGNFFNSHTYLDENGFKVLFDIEFN